MREYTKSAEQKARAAERREQFKAIAKRVAAMTDAERSAMVERIGCIPTCDGRILSVHNTCMILYQNASASMVGGFRQWLAHGRVVAKGQRGLSIWIPCHRKVDAERAASVGLGADQPDETFFTLGTVFDISQTVTTETAAADECERVGELSHESECAA